MATFSAQVISLVGGTPTQTELDTWCLQGVMEIAMQLPASLQEKCSDKSTLNNSTTTLDLNTATVGKVLYCTRSNGTYDKSCRLVSSAEAHLTEDSTATNFYATADDPAYFIRDNILEIKPTPTDAQPGKVYHIVYPSSIDANSGSDITIANFPNEAEHLVILYVAIKQLENYMVDEISNEDSTLYGLLSDKYTKISGEYAAGLAVLKGA